MWIPMDIRWLTGLDINLDLHIWIRIGYLRIVKDKWGYLSWISFLGYKYNNLNPKRYPLITNPILSYPMLSFPILSYPRGRTPRWDLPSYLYFYLSLYLSIFLSIRLCISLSIFLSFILSTFYGMKNSTSQVTTTY